DHLALAEMARGLGASLVERFQRRARQFELAGGLEADGPVGTAERNHLAVLLDRLPAEFGQAEQQVANAAFLLPRRSAMVVDAKDEFFMLGADAPVFDRLLAAGKNGQKVVSPLDQRAFGCVGAG